MSHWLQHCHDLLTHVQIPAELPGSSPATTELAPRSDEENARETAAGLEAVRTLDGGLGGRVPATKTAGGRHRY